MTKKVCLVIGAGGGIGANIARKFAIEGYHSCLARRTDQDGLDKWIKNIEAEGGEASGFLINAIEEGAIGGFGSHVVNFLTKKNLLDSNLKFRSMILPDLFIDQDKPEIMYSEALLDSSSIEEKIMDLINSNIVLQKQN